MAKKPDDKPNIHDPLPKDVSVSVDQPAGQDPTLETPPRSAGEDPNPNTDPHKAASGETPDATATPPQRVQTEKSNASMVDLPVGVEKDPLDTGKRYKVRVLRGVHSEGGRTYTKADGWFESKTDCVGRFGTEKFESAPTKDDDE